MRSHKCSSILSNESVEDSKSSESPFIAPYTVSLQKLRINNESKIIFGHININSLRNKFDSLIEGIHGRIDILMISETKLDDTFPEGQFKIHGYSKPYRLDRNSNGGGIMIFVREDIPSKTLYVENLPMESL